MILGVSEVACSSSILTPPSCVIGSAYRELIVVSRGQLEVCQVPMYLLVMMIAWSVELAHVATWHISRHT